jgi:hypothetical protein
MRFEFGANPARTRRVVFAGFRRASTRTIQSRHRPEIHDTAAKDFSHPFQDARDVFCDLVISY